MFIFLIKFNFKPKLIAQKISFIKSLSKTRLRISKITVTFKKKMPKPILYWNHISSPTRFVLLTATELGLQLELRPISLIDGDHLKPEFLKINPMHTIPTLNDNGVIIWDSHAICTYLVEKYGKDDQLYPKDLLQRAQVDQRLHFDGGFLFPRLRFCFV